MKTADACCEPVVSLDEAVASPLTQARNMVSRGPDGRRYLASPLKMSGSLPCEDLPAPELGHHTREILAQLGLGREDLESLAAQGVI
jgi:crotonobetainyl-CoA:carnitine CoA-transferase CaiB-like acyl-CoA transferase